MFATKRLAKRSIVGTRVCALQNGCFSAGTISAINRDFYQISFDDGTKGIFNEKQVYGSGFNSFNNCHLKPGQIVYITYNGREMSGVVEEHDIEENRIEIELILNDKFRVTRRIEDVRLLRSRKSARLQDHDKDYCKLADHDTKRRNVSSSIDVPAAKQRRSSECDAEDIMDDEEAALVLTSLSCSPHYINMPTLPTDIHVKSPISPSSLSSGIFSSGESPPSILSSSAPANICEDSNSSEDLEVDKQTKTVLQCTWKNCRKIMSTIPLIEQHIRQEHLGRGADQDWSDHEEDFYYTEIEIGIDSVTDFLADMHTSTPPPKSFLEHVRSSMQDHDYQRKDAYSANRMANSLPNDNYIRSFNHQPITVKKPTLPKYIKLKKSRSEIKKCRKVYGMENRDMWCTQCKWKKACSRFADL